MKDLAIRILWGIVAVWFAALVIDFIEWEIIKAHTTLILPEKTH